MTATRGNVVLMDFARSPQLKQLNELLDKRELTRALQVARDTYQPTDHYTTHQLLLLSAAFGAGIDVTPGTDIEQKQLCLSLWNQAVDRATPAQHEMLALSAVRLASIYIGRRQKILAHCSLYKARPFVGFGASSQAYNTAVNAYVDVFNQPDTDL